MPFCKGCGKEISGEVRFCPYCGYDQAITQGNTAYPRDFTEEMGRLRKSKDILSLVRRFYLLPSRAELDPAAA